MSNLLSVIEIQEQILMFCNYEKRNEYQLVHQPSLKKPLITKFV
jgi:hypothetical protein